MRKRATAKEVAERAGVSKWTVIRAFTQGASITEASREKVLAAARELNYTPNLLARSLATNLTHQVAVFVDDFANPHKLPFLERLTERLQAEGMVMALININRNLDHVNALLNADQRQFDAVILFGTAFRDDTLRDSRLGPGLPPTFVLARDSQIPGVPAVACDSRSALEEIVGHLYRRGYRKPAFMTGPKTLSTALGRRRHYLGFWKELGGMDVTEIAASGYGAEEGADALRRFLDGGGDLKSIDVLMCENDILAIGAIDMLRSQARMRIPEDIAIVGFDNVPLSAWPSYDLTTYEQPRDEMIDALVDMITGRRAAESLQLKGQFVQRGSA